MKRGEFDKSKVSNYGQKEGKGDPLHAEELGDSECIEGGEGEEFLKVLRMREGVHTHNGF